MNSTEDALTLNIGVAVVKRRQELGLTQEDLARRSHVNRTYISDLERGVSSMSVKTLERLAKALEMPGWQLVFIAEAKPSCRSARRNKRQVSARSVAR